jgi:hypothetical protein
LPGDFLRSFLPLEVVALVACGAAETAAAWLFRSRSNYALALAKLAFAFVTAASNAVESNAANSCPERTRSPGLTLTRETVPDALNLRSRRVDAVAVPDSDSVCSTSATLATAVRY